MNKLKSIFLLILIANVCYGQGFVKMDTIDNPTRLTQMINGSIKRTFRVDFSGDGLSDYICQLDSIEQETASYKEIWITSDFKIIKTIDKYVMDYDFFWFANLDNDLEPEIFSAAGYSDGIDYCFIDQDLKTGNDKILFYFNPVIIDNENKYWGYPWDISDLIIQEKQGQIRLHCSLDHDITRDGAIKRPDWQNIFPVICFTGQSTQPNIKVGQINRLDWLEINEIIEKINR
jgi:hypothetical protein